MSEELDPSALYGRSRSSGRVDQEGREIRLVGAPILAWDPATNNLCVPDRYRNHSLVRGRFFYTLPSDVLEAAVAEVCEDRFDTELLTMERQLSTICGDHALNIGFWQDVAIAYGELRTNEVRPIPDEFIRETGHEPAVVNFAMRTYRERDVAPLQRFSRGYCGWLMTNQQFLDEHDALLADHADAVCRWGTHQAATFLPESYRGHMVPGESPHDDPLWQAFVADFEPFLLRWRLAGLAGPYLPMPSKPLMAGSFPLSTVQRLMDAGGVFYVPDTMPIPSRSQFRDMLDDALQRGESPEHLTEWLNISRADNMAKNQMDPFVRRFELQHYWRILHQRHAAALDGNLGRCQKALAEILGVQPKQIGRDLTTIRERLGDDWVARDWPID